MLVCVWDSYDAAIPRIEAFEHLSAYTIAVAATPYAEDKHRTSIIKDWRERILGTSKHIQVKEGPEILEDGTVLQRGRMDVPLKEVFSKIKGAFGRAIRD